jgi:2-polyprenyl-6-methoxyphenol hydroxylase-like FAD-dependent oxidoreductase
MRLLPLLGFLSLLSPSVVVSAAASINESTFAPCDVIEKDIAIIGGGSSGTYAAVRLREDYNKSIIVVEKTDRLVCVPSTCHSLSLLHHGYMCFNAILIPTYTTTGRPRKHLPRPQHRQTNRLRRPRLPPLRQRHRLLQPLQHPHQTLHRRHRNRRLRQHRRRLCTIKLHPSLPLSCDRRV